MGGNETPGRIVRNAGVGVHDVFTSGNFYDYHLRGLGVVGGQILGFSNDLRRRPYNTLALYRASVWSGSMGHKHKPQRTDRNAESIQRIRGFSTTMRYINRHYLIYLSIQSIHSLLYSSRMRVINHNWSATKQHLHPQSVAEISRHSVLSGDRSWQCETSSGSRHKDTDQCM